MKLIAVAVALALPSSSFAQVKAVLPASPRLSVVPVAASVLPAISGPAVPLTVSALSVTPSVLAVPSIMPSPSAVSVPAALVPNIMKNSPKPVAAKPSLEALASGLAEKPGAPATADALNRAFDAAEPFKSCAACAGDEIPAGVPQARTPNPLSASSGRLSKSVLPKNYKLRLSLDPENASFTGKVKVVLTSKTPTRQLVLNSLDLSYSVVVVNGRRLNPSQVVVDNKAETVTLLLDEAVKGPVVLEAEYTGKMNELMRGQYKSRGKNGDKPEAWAFTHLEPTHARRVLPSFDEPSFKASFQLTLEVPEGLTPISNTPSVSEAIANGRKTVEFAQTPKMSSYLLAVYAARLVPKSRKVGKNVLTVWAAPDQIAQADFALDAGEKALKYLNKYFALPYMLPKLDMVAAPDFASGAMENWGAILYRDSSLLIDPKLSSDAAKRRVAEVVSHEIVHQWFGDLVTMEWWNDLWLNEAFATWVAYKVVDSWKPEWKVWDEFDQGKRSPLSIDALPGTRAVRSQASTPAEIQAMFDPMSYQKGGALLRMFEDFVGEKAFREGVRAYMRRYAYKNAESAQLWREIEKASGKPVRAMAEKWLERPGVPVVSVAMTNSYSRSLMFEQKRFSAFGVKDATLWPIPVTVRYRLKGERKARVHRMLLGDGADWGGHGAVSLPGKGELLWAYPNAGELGYYRLSFGGAALARLLAHKNELTPVERSGLLNNLWAQARAGNMTVADFLGALSSFKGDESRVIVEDAAAYLKTIRQNLAASEADQKALADFAADFFAPQLARLGWDKKRRESQEATMTRPTVLNALALLAPERLDQKQVTASLEKYLADPSSLDASIAPVVLTAAARRNDPALFEAFRARLAAPKTPEQKSLMLRSLAEFSEPALHDKYLGMTLSEEIRAQDAWMPFVWLLSNPATRERSWAFVKANWPALVAKLGPRGATRVIDAAGALVAEGKKEEVGAFFADPANEVEMARKTLAQTLESIDLGLRFQRGQAPSFAEWTAAKLRR